MSTFDLDRLSDLLVDQATAGLSNDEKAELKRLLDKAGVEDDWSFDQVAAMIDLQMAREEMQELPSHIRSRVLSEADQVVLQTTSIESKNDNGGLGFSNSEAATSPVALPGKTSSPTKREMIAWVATAAAVLLAAFVWFGRGTNSERVASEPLIAAAASAAVEKFVSQSDVFEVELSPGNDVTGSNATARVYWDRQSKNGYVKISGLRSNDPSIEQYQLWVIDKTRGIEDRPNAGVFDFTANGEMIFKFRSDLKVFEAQGFAITVEKPGGVNKSDLSRIALANLGG